MENILFTDVRTAPFSIHGLYQPHNGLTFRRLPEEVAKACNVHIAEGLYLNTAGGRVRFCTDAEEMIVRVVRAPFELGRRSSPLLEFAIDLYHRQSGSHPAAAGKRCVHRFGYRTEI